MIISVKMIAVCCGGISWNVQGRITEFTFGVLTLLASLFPKAYAPFSPPYSLKSDNVY